MQDEVKSKEQLIAELHELRQRLSDSERDKAERKRAEEALRKAQEQLKLILDTVPALIWQKDREGNCLQVNKACCDTLGLSAETILGKTDYDLFPAEIADQYVSADRKILNSGTPEFGTEEQHQKPSGEQGWSSTDKIVHYDIDGHIAGTIGFALDITEHKLAAEALWESEGKVNALLEAIADHMTVIDKELNIVWANATATGMFGNDIIGRKCYKVFHRREEPCEPHPCIVLKAFKDGRIHEHVTEAVNKEGKTINLHCTATVALRDKDNKPIRVLEISRDVTERKRAEEALKHSQQMLQNVLDNFPGGVFWKDRNLVYQGCSRAFAKAAGLNTPSEIIGKTDYDMPWAEWEAEEYRYTDREVMQSGVPRLRLEESQHEADGRVGWYETSQVPLFDAKGNIVGILGVSGDITERRQAEEALRESQALLSATIESIPFEFWAISQDGRYILVNSPCTKHYGDIRGQKPEEICPNQEVLSIWEDNNRRAFRGELVDGEVKSVFEEEEVIYYNIIAPIRDGDQIQGILGLNIDITERKRMEQELRRAYDELEFRVQERTAELERANEALRAEIARRKQTQEALREAEKKYRSLFENAREGIYQSTPEGNYLTVNPAMARSYGFSSPKEMIGSIDSIDHQIFVIPEKRRELKLILETKGEVNDFEVQQRRKDGTTFWASLNVHADYAEGGSILYWEGRSVDITERKRAEKALKQSEEQLRFLSSRLLEAQEEERKRIAGELHDSIGQSLAAIKFNVENVLKETGKDLNGRIVNSLQQIIPLVQNSMEEVRRIYTGLRPSMLDDLGIIATIGWFCREFQNTYESICIEQQMGIEEAEIPEPLKIVIFRIVQEALNNIAKHSGAELVNVCLERRDGRIELAIEDNGTGFDIDSALVKGSHEKGFGIAGMKERTEFAGGTFSIESVVGKGTTIHAAWPSNATFG